MLHFNIKDKIEIRYVSLDYLSILVFIYVLFFFRVCVEVRRVEIGLQVDFKYKFPVRVKYNPIRARF